MTIDLDKGPWTKENIAFTKRILNKMEDDPHLPTIFELIENKVVNIWLVLAYLAKAIKPARYMELGVRRGFSMAIVGARCKDAKLVGFDIWAANYGGAPNPGPDFVRSELAKVGHRGEIEFVDGECNITVPNYKPAELFPFILADAAHGEDSVYRDIMNCLPLIEPGGFLIVDDLQDDAVMRAWDKAAASLGLWAWHKDRVGVICNGD